MEKDVCGVELVRMARFGNWGVGEQLTYGRQSWCCRVKPVRLLGLAFIRSLISNMSISAHFSFSAEAASSFWPVASFGR